MTSNSDVQRPRLYSREDYEAYFKGNTAEADLLKGAIVKKSASAPPAWQPFFRHLYEMANYRTNFSPPDEAMVLLEDLMQEALELLERSDTPQETRENFILNKRPSIKMIGDLLVKYLEKAYELQDVQMGKRKKDKPGFFGVARGASMLFNFFVQQELDVQKSQSKGFIRMYVYYYVLEQIAAKFALGRGETREKFQQDILDRFEAIKLLDEEETYPGREGLRAQLSSQDRASTMAVSLLSAKKYFGEETQLNKGIELNTPSWQAIGDYFKDFIRQEANVELTSAAIDFPLPKSELVVMIDPATYLEKFRMAHGHVLPHDQFQYMTQAFSRQHLAGIRTEKDTKIATSNESFLFNVTLDGRLAVRTDFEAPLLLVLGERNYYMLRAHVLYMLASLTIARYRLRPFKDIVEGTLPPDRNRKRRHHINHFPRHRDILIEDPTQADSAGSEATADSMEEPVASPAKPGWAPNHKRFLAPGNFPSLRNYLRAQKNQEELRAMTIDPRPGQERIVQTLVVNGSLIDYGNFIQNARSLRKTEEMKGYIVRFETPVEGHGTPTGPMQDTRSKVEDLYGRLEVQ